MKRLRNILYYNQKYLLIIASIILILGILYINYNPSKSIYSQSEKEFQGIVIKHTYKQEKASIIIKNKEKLLINYYTKEEPNIKTGDTIKVEGELLIPSKNTVPNLFNYQKYLYNNKIYYYINTNSITLVKKNTGIINHIRNTIETKLNQYKKISPYLKTFILADQNDLEGEVKESYQINGISHLFSISGMHVSIISLTILYFLKKISYNKLFNYSIVMSFILFYLMITDFPPSLLRSAIFFLYSSLNDIYNLKIKTINRSLLVLITIIALNPYYLCNLGFQLSYIVSFSLILFQKKINLVNGYFKKLIIISTISFLVSFPIIINTNFEVNILSIVLNLFYVPLICYIILPLLFITIIIPPLENITYLIITIFEQTSLMVSNINTLKIVFSKPSIYLILIYYLIIFLSLFNKKHYIVLIIIIIYHQLKVYFNPTMSIIMLDVGQGDSIFVKYPNNNLNILIDTGGNQKYEISKQTIIPYLKSIGIKKIDYLILTHGDYDHIGSSNYLVDNFKTNKVIFNNNQYNNLELSLIKKLNNNGIKYYQNINKISKKNHNIFFINDIANNDENESSLIIYIPYYKHQILLMGDATKSNEKEILKKYSFKNIDVLKVGHHGSKTSSSEYFIKEINPVISLISVGKNNIYKHPSSEVINTLSQSKIFQTSLNGSILINFKEKTYTIHQN